MYFVQHLKHCAQRKTQEQQQGLQCSETAAVSHAMLNADEASADVLAPMLVCLRRCSAQGCQCKLYLEERQQMWSMERHNGIITVSNQGSFYHMAGAQKHCTFQHTHLSWHKHRYPVQGRTKTASCAHMHTSNESLCEDPLGSSPHNQIHMQR